MQESLLKAPARDKRVSTIKTRDAADISTLVFLLRSREQKKCRTAGENIYLCICTYTRKEVGHFCLYTPITHGDREIIFTVIALLHSGIISRFFDVPDVFR